MIYSVWDQRRGRYDYYDDGATSAETSAPKPTHLRPSDEMGAVPERAAWRLPADAKKIGDGSAARGQVASQTGGGGALGVLPDFTTDNLVLLAALGVGAFYLWKGRLPFMEADKK